jgi:uncharacterized phosphosugar-binding protein
MAELEYLDRITKVISQIRDTQKDKLEKAAQQFAKSIQSGGRVYMFGSGHSVIPVLDIFPRYGSFIGFYPIYDPRLMWSNVVGPGGARELLWLEQREGYAKVILSSYNLKPNDSLLVFSHGGLNAAPIEMGIEAKKSGVTIVSVSSHANYRHAKRGSNSPTYRISRSTIVFPPKMHSLLRTGFRRNLRPAQRWHRFPSP